MELIDRQQAIDEMNGLPKHFDKTDTLCLDYADVLAVLSEHLPSAQPEQKTGKWIAIKNRNGTTVALRCSSCGNSPKKGISSDFCPNCGADMRGEKE